MEKDEKHNSKKVGGKGIEEAGGVWGGVRAGFAGVTGGWYFSQLPLVVWPPPAYEREPSLKLVLLCNLPRYQIIL
jgi:hypothetical protein